ncbi:MAG: hypothetical protein FWF53_05235 [Candidatus Azobacteroides sp.]|nr:hypothetical protein [Candidatus Azobacteroides sp.]
MKKFLLTFALLIGTVSAYNTIEAQGINVNLNINVGNQPAWGPVGYDYVDYYYFPDINCYYNVNLDLFYFLSGGRWMAARYLPYAFHSYDLYGMYKVVLVGVTDPWRYNAIHVRDYGRYIGYKNQPIIRDSRDVRYRDSRNNKIIWYADKNNGNTFNGNNVGSVRRSDSPAVSGRSDGAGRNSNVTTRSASSAEGQSYNRTTPNSERQSANRTTPNNEGQNSNRTTPNSERQSANRTTPNNEGQSANRTTPNNERQSANRTTPNSERQSSNRTAPNNERRR